MSMNWYKLAQETQEIEETQEEDYRGIHTAPTKESGAPLHNLTNIYPDDIYSNEGARFYGHYGHNHPLDQQSINIIQNARNKPNSKVKIYRAIPDTNYEINQKIKEISKVITYHNKFNFFPMNNPIVQQLEINYPIEQFPYDEQQKEILTALFSQLTHLNQQVSKQNKSINPGDWVTISLPYAKEHGKANLNNKYTILTKTVNASEIFSDGDSIHEWGYNP